MKKTISMPLLVVLFTMILSPAFGQKYSRKQLSLKSDTLSNKTNELHQKISSLEEKLAKIQQNQGEAASNDDLWEVEKKANQIGNSLGNLYEDLATLRTLIDSLPTSKTGKDSVFIFNNLNGKILAIEKKMNELKPGKESADVKNMVSEAETAANEAKSRAEIAISTTNEFEARIQALEASRAASDTTMVNREEFESLESKLGGQLWINIFVIGLLICTFFMAVIALMKKRILVMSKENEPEQPEEGNPPAGGE